MIASMIKKKINETMNIFNKLTEKKQKCKKLTWHKGILKLYMQIPAKTVML